MARLSIDVSAELKQKLLQYIAKKYDSFYGKINEVVTKAIEEYLEKHGGAEGD